MKNRGKSRNGQSIVETVLALVPLLVLLGGGYWFYRYLSLSSSALSAAHAQMLRAGRRLAGIEPQLSAMIQPGEQVVRIMAHNDPLIAEVPLFHGLAGRTVASADISFEKEPVGGFLDLPYDPLHLKAEGAVDCWGKESRSGSMIGRTVQGILLTGVLR